MINSRVLKTQSSFVSASLFVTFFLRRRGKTITVMINYSVEDKKIVTAEDANKKINLFSKKKARMNLRKFFFPVIFGMKNSNRKLYLVLERATKRAQGVKLSRLSHFHEILKFIITQFILIKLL